MKDVFDLLKSAREHWKSPFGLLVGLLAATAGALLLFSQLGLGEIPVVKSTPWARTILVSVVDFGVFVSWLSSRTLPRVKKGKLGFVVAIGSESDQQRQRLEADFIRVLQRAVDSAQDGGRFQLVRLPEKHACSIDCNETARKYLSRVGGHFLVWGDVRERKVKGKDTYLLRLEGMVAHASVPMDVSKRLASEMGSILPRNVQIDCESDFVGFELTSLWLADSAKLIIATAAMVSGDLALSRTLLEELHGSSSKYREERKVPGIGTLIRLVPEKLAYIYSVLSNEAYARWRRDKDTSALVEAVEHATQAGIIAGDPRKSATLVAICDFVVRRDTKAALKNIRSAGGGKKTVATQFNLAFLEAYEGRLERAITIYNSIKKQGVDVQLVFEIEEFIGWVLDHEPEKSQLHFLVAYLNAHFKGDSNIAASHYAKFATSNEAINPAIQCHANLLLDKIRALDIAA